MYFILNILDQLNSSFKRGHEKRQLRDENRIPRVRVLTRLGAKAEHIDEVDYRLKTIYI